MHIVCAHCSSTNRIPEDKTHIGAKCGKCGEAIYSGTPVNLNDASFYQFVEKNHMPVIVDFWAEWCGPCKAMGPAFESVAKESDGILFAKVNTENAPSVSADAVIRSIPTLIFFHKGKEIDRVSGGLSESQIKQWIMQSLQKL
ncbi:thioredoxin TrxC [Glaciecola sp. MF2-115]|uniref:thioredoxin TrxC n=1 Tax=Glaciecola sp. MF2-115 TaxID=3384827 RepID=UPI0039A38E15